MVDQVEIGLIANPILIGCPILIEYCMCWSNPKLVFQIKGDNFLYDSQIPLGNTMRFLTPTLDVIIVCKYTYPLLQVKLNPFIK